MELILKLWLYLAFALTGAIGFYLCVNRKTISVSRMMVGLFIISLPLHMFEERIFPGGFHFIYGVMSGMVQTQLVVLSCNVTVLAVLSWLFIKKGRNTWVALLTALFAIMEFVLHLVEAVISYSLYHDIGLLIPYSPGFVVTIVMMLPIGILTLWDLIKNKRLARKEVLKGVAALFLIAFLTVLLPNIVFNNSPYPYPDNGFYELFLQ